jgi:hypothetical protein
MDAVRSRHLRHLRRAIALDGRAECFRARIVSGKLLNSQSIRSGKRLTRSDGRSGDIRGLFKRDFLPAASAPECLNRFQGPLLRL